MYCGALVNLYTRDIEAGIRFYGGLLGLRETFRTPREGTPEHVEQRDAVLAEIRAFLANEPLPIAPQANLDPPSDLDGPIGDVG